MLLTVALTASMLIGWVEDRVSAITPETPFTPIRPTDTPTIEAVKSFVNINRDKLGLTDKDALFDWKVIPVAQHNIVRARRRHLGTFVIGNDAAFRLDQNANIIRHRTAFDKIEALPPKPSISDSMRRQYRLAAMHQAQAARTIVISVSPLKLAIHPTHQTWCFVQFVKTARPDKDFIQILDPNGYVIENRSVALHAEATAFVYKTHPNATDDSITTEAVILDNLTVPNALSGTTAVTKSCIGESDKMQILVCDDIAPIVVPIIAGHQGFPIEGDISLFFDNITCDQLEEYFPIPDQFKYLAIPVCDTAHRAVIADFEVAAYEQFSPLDTQAAIDSGEAFADAFAEVQIYYHMNEAMKWFTELGYSFESLRNSKPHQGLANMSIPDFALVECATGKMKFNDTKDNVSARQYIDECMVENNQDFAFSGFENAFFTSAGEFTALIGYQGGGLFLGQGKTADFAYDGDVVYHEFGHGVVSDLGALQVPSINDVYGIDSAPGALNEAYADYFSASITGDPLMGAYVAQRTGMGEAIRKLNHNHACPSYMTGESHDDSLGWSGALWEAREIYPETETTANGIEIRIFDRAVFAGLSMLTSRATLEAAALETAAAVKAEAGLGDPAATKISEVFSNRNIMGCERSRDLDPANTIAKVFLAGNQGYTPFAPGPFQFVTTAATLPTTDEMCVTIQTTTGKERGSLEDAPDLIATGEQEQESAKFGLLVRADLPVEFTYLGGGQGGLIVSSAQVNSEVEFKETAAGVYIASARLPQAEAGWYFALVNRAGQQMVLRDTTIDTTPGKCAPAQSPAPTTPNQRPPVNTTAAVETPERTAEHSGCQSIPATLLGLVLTMLWGMGFLRRKTGAVNQV